MANLNDIERKIQYIIDILSGDIIVGTLPLTFTAHTAGNASDWTIYGNNEIYDGQQGVGERTVNLFDYSQGCDWASGSNGASNQKITAQQGNVFTVKSTSALYALVRGYDANDAIISGSGWSTGGTSTYTAPANIAYVKVIFRNFDYSSITAEQKATINEAMLVKGSTAPSTYVPYGYEIPISVNGTPQTFYIGDSPLTAGQSISKTSTGIDIQFIEGENNVDTTLYNKPKMTIKI